MTDNWPRYQSLWRNGQTVGPSRRDCESRYAAISAHLSYNVGGIEFAALDFGCYGPYFGHRLAEEYGAHVIAADDEPFLVQRYQPPARGSLAIIPAKLEPGQLASLGQFRVTLALSVLHHLPNWRSYLTVLQSNSSLLYVETSAPPEELPGAAAQGEALLIEQDVIQRGGVPLVTTPGYDSRYERTLWVIRR